MIQHLFHGAGLSRSPGCPRIAPMNRRPAPLAAVVLAALSCHGGGDPAIQSVEPRVAARNSPFALEITGTGFGGATTSKDSAPTLFIERTRDLDGNPVPGPSDSGLVRVEVAGGTERISVGLTLLDEAPSGFYGVRVVTRSGGTASFPDAFAVLPVPQVQGLQETAFCLAEGSPASLVFTGTDLPVIGGLGPSATVSNGLAPYDFGAWSAILSSTPSGCRRVPFKRADLRLCDGLAMALPMEAPTGDLSATLSFPAPSDQHVPAPNVAFLVDRPLSLPAFPGGPYAPVDGPADLIVRGKVHAPIEPAPSATIAGSAVATRPEECTASTVPGHRWRVARRRPPLTSWVHLSWIRSRQLSLAQAIGTRSSESTARDSSTRARFSRGARSGSRSRARAASLARSLRAISSTSGAGLPSLVDQALTRCRSRTEPCRRCAPPRRSL